VCCPAQVGARPSAAAYAFARVADELSSDCFMFDVSKFNSSLNYMDYISLLVFRSNSTGFLFVD